jgi:galactokinase/mevalonate kinase-like predicted kinase
MSWTTTWSGSGAGSGPASIGCVVVSDVPPSTGVTTSSAIAGAPVTTVMINVVQIAANPCRTLTVPPLLALWVDL